MMYNVIGIEKGTDNKIIIEPNMTEAQAMKMCESWGWSYDDGRKSYAMDIEKVEAKEKIEEEEKPMEITREEVIAKVKEMNISKFELGFDDPYRAYYEKMIQITKELIDECEIPADKARDIVDEEYWDILGIEDKRYKIIEMKLSKTIYKTVRVVVREDESEYDTDNYVDSDNADYWEGEEDEDYWGIEDTRVLRNNLEREDAEDYDTVNDINDCY